MIVTKGDSVKVVTVEGKVLNDAMKDWISEHDGKVFRVERVVGTAAKLYKVDFWVSTDLLAPSYRASSSEENLSNSPKSAGVQAE